MTNIEFEILSNFEKANVLNRYGFFLCERIVSGNWIYLYSLNYFYVELFHELADVHDKGITILSIFDDVKYLDQYIDDIDITTLQAGKLT